MDGVDKATNLPLYSGICVLHHILQGYGETRKNNRRRTGKHILYFQRFNILFNMTFFTSFNLHSFTAFNKIICVLNSKRVLAYWAISVQE